MAIEEDIIINAETKGVKKSTSELDKLKDSTDEARESSEEFTDQSKEQSTAFGDLAKQAGILAAGYASLQTLQAVWNRTVSRSIRLQRQIAIENAAANAAFNVLGDTLGDVLEIFIDTNDQTSIFASFLQGLGNAANKILPGFGDALLAVGIKADIAGKAAAEAFDIENFQIIPLENQFAKLERQIEQLDTQTEAFVRAENWQEVAKGAEQFNSVLTKLNSNLNEQEEAQKAVLRATLEAQGLSEEQIQQQLVAVETEFIERRISLEQFERTYAGWQTDLIRIQNEGSESALDIVFEEFEGRKNILEGYTDDYISEAEKRLSAEAELSAQFAEQDRKLSEDAIKTREDAALAASSRAVDALQTFAGESEVVAKLVSLQQAAVSFVSALSDPIPWPAPGLRFAYAAAVGAVGFAAANQVKLGASAPSTPAQGLQRTSDSLNGLNVPRQQTGPNLLPQNNVQTVLVLEDFTEVANRVTVTEDRTSL